MPINTGSNPNAWEGLFSNLLGGLFGGQKTTSKQGVDQPSLFGGMSEFLGSFFQILMGMMGFFNNFAKANNPGVALEGEELQQEGAREYAEYIKFLDPKKQEKLNEVWRKKPKSPEAWDDLIESLLESEKDASPALNRLFKERTKSKTFQDNLKSFSEAHQGIYQKVQKDLDKIDLKTASPELKKMYFELKKAMLNLVQSGKAEQDKIDAMGVQYKQLMGCVQAAKIEKEQSEKLAKIEKLSTQAKRIYDVVNLMGLDKLDSLVAGTPEDVATIKTMVQNLDKQQKEAAEQQRMMARSRSASSFVTADSPPVSPAFSPASSRSSSPLKV